MKPVVWDKILNSFYKKQYSNVGYKMHKGADSLLSKNIDDLYTRSKAYTDIVFCGLHYGMCVHSALKRLSTAYPKCNYYVKRDMCCPMPLHSLDQYDSDVKYEGAKII